MMQATFAPSDEIAEALRSLEMPREEIRAVTTSTDPELVRRYLELHRERLAERLATRLEALDAVGRDLVSAATRRRLVSWPNACDHVAVEAERGQSRSGTPARRRSSP